MTDIHAPGGIRTCKLASEQPQTLALDFSVTEIGIPLYQWTVIVADDRLGNVFYWQTKQVVIHSFIHSFISNLSDDRSTASSKTIPPLNAI
jgi:hypothetical protein